MKKKHERQKKAREREREEDCKKTRATTNTTVEKTLFTVRKREKKNREGKGEKNYTDAFAVIINDFTRRLFPFFMEVFRKSKRM